MPECRTCGVALAPDESLGLCAACWDAQERADDDYSCCALREGHDGCCAYRCSTCDGTQRLHFTDDLGCMDRGCPCDGYGYCAECGGTGWFNEFGDSCMAPTPDELPLEVQG